LCQYDETHGQLLKGGAVSMLALHTARAHGSHANSVVQSDVLAAINLAFLCHFGGSDVATRVPLRTVHSMVHLLYRRLWAESASSVVKSSLFCGLPVNYRPCFVTKALAALLEVSSSHVAAAWQTLLPELVVGILKGDLPNDEKTDVPLKSPDSLDTAGRCRAALLTQKGSSFVEDERAAALSAVQGPQDDAHKIHRSATWSRAKSRNVFPTRSRL